MAMSVPSLPVLLSHAERKCVPVSLRLDALCKEMCKLPFTSRFHSSAENFTRASEAILDWGEIPALHRRASVLTVLRRPRGGGLQKVLTTLSEINWRLSATSGYENGAMETVSCYTWTL